jgi:pyruvate dehydrogenase E2 component (dihydrolipoamide acetyltransferase)
VTKFKLPELGENIEQGDLVRLMVQPGATVNEGQPVMELETDKAVIEVPSSVSGVVQDIRVKEGDKLKVGQVIFTVDGAAGNGKQPKAAKTAEQPPEKKASPEPQKKAEAQAEKKMDVPSPPSTSGSARRATDRPSAASEFRLPELGENISQGDLVRLMIAPGAKVSEGQPVIELETDKAVVEVPSSVSGVVKEVHVKEGEKVKVGQVIFPLSLPRSRSLLRWNTFPGSTARGLHFKPPSRPKGRRKSKLCRQTSRSLHHRHSPCRHSWEKLPGTSIATPFPQHPACDDSRGNWASIFTR